MTADASPDEGPPTPHPRLSQDWLENAARSFWAMARDIRGWRDDPARPGGTPTDGLSRSYQDGADAS